MNLYFQITCIICPWTWISSTEISKTAETPVWSSQDVDKDWCSLMWVERIPFLSLFFHLKTAELWYPVVSLQQGQVLLLSGNNQAESWAVAEAFSQLQKNPCLCLTSPVTGVGWGAHIPLLSQSCCLLWVQEILTPSNCSWPQSIILAKARSCIFFSKDWAWVFSPLCNLPCSPERPNTDQQQ